MATKQGMATRPGMATSTEHLFDKGMATKQGMAAKSEKRAGADKEADTYFFSDSDADGTMTKSSSAV
eukprot:3279956-Karenia_brevis.AAC.1